MQNHSHLPHPTDPGTIATFPGALPEPALKAVLTVEELAKRWCTHPESIRRLIRRKEIKTLRGFRPFRITFDEIRRYETHDAAAERRKEILARHGR